MYSVYMIYINKTYNIYLLPGPPRLASSLTASCLALILLTMSDSSDLSPSVSWSTAGMAVVVDSLSGQHLSVAFYGF